MAQDKQLTYYTSPYSPYCHRVHIALEEAKAKFIKCEIDLRPGYKPGWFTKVNPRGLVPAFTYGGPRSPPEQPSPGSLKLSESVVLIEFIADLYPDAGLRPEDPELCAKARLFITLSHDTLHHAFRCFFFRGERIDTVLPSLEAFQALLAPSGFAIGPWSMADAVVAPMIVRFMRLSALEIGKYPLGEGKKLLKALAEPKFARFMRYYQSLWDRPSVRTTWDEPTNVKMWRIHPNVTRGTSALGH
ncbi:glutathione transferase omega class [Trametes sanguinea]|nr:glutathione transferase omega class [Trametes sanguinea]